MNRHGETNNGVAAKGALLAQEDLRLRSLVVPRAGIFHRVALAERSLVLAISRRNRRNGQVERVSGVAAILRGAFHYQRGVAQRQRREINLVPDLLGAEHYLARLLGALYRVNRHGETNNGVAAKGALLVQEDLLLRSLVVPRAGIFHRVALTERSLVLAISRRNRLNGQVERVGRVAVMDRLVCGYQGRIAYRQDREVYILPGRVRAFDDSHGRLHIHLRIDIHRQLHDRVTAVDIFLGQRHQLMRRAAVGLAFKLVSLSGTEADIQLAVMSRRCQDMEEKRISRVTTMDGLVLRHNRGIAYRQFGEVFLLPYRIRTGVHRHLFVEGIYRVNGHCQCHDRVTAVVVLLSQRNLFLRCAVIPFALVLYRVTLADSGVIYAVAGRSQNGQMERIGRVAIVERLILRYNRGIRHREDFGQVMALPSRIGAGIYLHRLFFQIDRIETYRQTNNRVSAKEVFLLQKHVGRPCLFVPCAAELSRVALADSNRVIAISIRNTNNRHGLGYRLRIVVELITCLHRRDSSLSYSQRAQLVILHIGNRAVRADERYLQTGRSICSEAERAVRVQFRDLVVPDNRLVVLGESCLHRYFRRSGSIDSRVIRREEHRIGSLSFLRSDGLVLPSESTRYRRLAAGEHRLRKTLAYHQRRSRRSLYNLYRREGEGDRLRVRSRVVFFVTGLISRDSHCTGGENHQTVILYISNRTIRTEINHLQTAGSGSFKSRDLRRRQCLCGQLKTVDGLVERYRLDTQINGMGSRSGFSIRDSNRTGIYGVPLVRGD